MGEPNFKLQMDPNKYQKFKKNKRIKRKIGHIGGIIAFYGTLATLTGPLVFKTVLAGKAIGLVTYKANKSKIKHFRYYNPLNDKINKE